MLEYDFDPTSYKLGDVFEEMERVRRVLPVTDYSVAQNTLDNVSYS